MNKNAYLITVYKPEVEFPEIESLERVSDNMIFYKIAELLEEKRVFAVEEVGEIVFDAS